MNRSVLVAALASSAILGAAAASSADAIVTVKPEAKHQTILGWGASVGRAPLAGALRDDLMDAAVGELGLTRLRLERPGHGWEYPYNDDGDPLHFNWSAFRPEVLDDQMRQRILPFRDRVRARGEPFNLYVSPSFFKSGSTGDVEAWMLQNPGEYAEWAVALLVYLRDKHGLVADFYSICNEAANNNAFSPQVVGRMIKALGPRLRAEGLPTKIEFPESVNSAAAWAAIQALKDDEEVWRYVGVVTYHLYGDRSFRPKIRDFAAARGIPTGQTEFMGTTIDDMYEDLTEGGVSFWEHYGLGGPGHGNGSYFHTSLSQTSFDRYTEYWKFRQVMHYVRPGAVRVDAESDDPAVRALAFVRDAKTTVVLLRTTAPWEPRTVVVKGLSPGRYGVCRAPGHGPYEELGVQTAGDAGTLTVKVPSGSVLTVYPMPDANQPPTVTDWRAKPNFLTAPAAAVTLLASATDPEKDPVTYAWSVASQPAGAKVELQGPNSATCDARGLSATGEYAFALAVSDPTHKVVRNVRLRVFPDNQPPAVIDLHSRIPVTVTLPQTQTELRGGGMDIEGDPMKYSWSVASQPAGAAAALESPTEGKCKASNLTVAGDYVFRFEVRDPTHTVSKDLTVKVYPVESPPQVVAIAAAPAALALPSSETQLTAETKAGSEPTISHWWSVKSAPPGAAPAFSAQARPDTRATGLTVPGKYVFTLTVVGRSQFAARDVTVTVAKN